MIAFCSLCSQGYDTEIGHGCISTNGQSLPNFTQSHYTLGSGIKHDGEKPDMSLLSSIAMTEVAKVMTFGKKKYAAHNWRGGFVWSRPAAAALRHIFAWLGGEDKDPETGLSHLAHASCCLMFLLEFEQTHKQLDDRHKGATNADNKK